MTSDRDKRRKTSAANATKQADKRPRPPKKSSFKTEHGRTYRLVESTDTYGIPNEEWVPFASEVNVLALTRNADGEEWGRLVEVVDRDGMRHLWSMPLALTAGSGEELRKILHSLGMELEPGREARAWLMEYLTSAEPGCRARCVQRIGWHDGVFVLPDQTFGESEDGEDVFLQSAERADDAFNVAGTLDAWRDQVARPAVGNSRLIFAISLAFASPLLALTGDEGGGFHLRGASSSGKSTVLAVAGSVWGGGGTLGYVQNWRTTDNALEGTAEMHCDTLLCLDELSQVEPRAAHRGGLHAGERKRQGAREDRRDRAAATGVAHALSEQR